MSDRLREAAKASLSAMQDVLEAAYHRCYQECCGRPGMECCGQPLQAWSPDDQHIMDTLGPVERDLRAALAADAERVSVPSSDFDKVVDEFLADYEFEGDEGTYTPNEYERALLADFGHGLIALMEDSDMLAAAENDPQP